MARLFSLANATAIDDPEFGHFEADEAGGFDLPDELSARLHRYHHRKKKAWENEEERDLRLHGDELARRRDPESLYLATQDIVGEFRNLAAQLAGAAGGGREKAQAEAEALNERIRDLEARLADAEKPPATAATPAPVPKTAPKAAAAK